VSSAGAVLIADRAPHGVEHVRAMLVGNLLAVRPREVLEVAALYAGVGLLHWLCRRPFFLISTDPEAAFAEGWRLRMWDFIFYASFGVVVTSSVRVGGVLLVFSYLIVPSLAAVILGGSVRTKLLIGWMFGTAVSVVGVGVSAALDLPTGATVVCVFGVSLLVFWRAARALGPLSGRTVLAGAGSARAVNAPRRG
jgi:zinc/manganese transport system permease protein